MKSAGIIDTQLQGKVYEFLIADPVIIDVLAKNKNWAKPNGKLLDKRNSFIPVNKGPLPNTPYLTYQNIGETPLGEHTNTAVFIIRCYNALQEDFILLNDILSRVKVLLDRKRFSFEGFSAVELRAVGTGTELEDQAWSQNFRELTFQIVYL